MSKKKEYTEDIKLQIYKIIAKYACSNSNIRSLLTKEGEIEDFISYAYAYYLDKLYSNYDPEKGALSTHIYACMNKLYPVFIQQTKNNVSFTLARTLINTDPSRAKAVDFYRSIYNAKGIDTCGDAIESVSPSTDDYIPDIALADEESDPYHVIFENNSNYTCEELKNTEVGRVFEDCLNRYMNKNSNQWGNSEYIIERNKDIIWRYTFRDGTKNVTYQSLADKWGGLSRERVRQIIDKFYHWASKDKTLREALKL